MRMSHVVSANKKNLTRSKRSARSGDMKEIAALLLEIHAPLRRIFHSLFLVLQPTGSLILPQKYLSSCLELLESEQRYQDLIEELKKS